MRKENGMSAKAKIIKAQYKTHRITAEDVWAYADEVSSPHRRRS